VDRLDQTSANRFTTTMEKLIGREDVAHPDTWFFDPFSNFVEQMKEKILGRDVERYKGIYNSDVLAKIAKEHPAFDQALRKNKRIDSPDEPINNLRDTFNDLRKGRGRGTQYPLLLTYWMMCRYPEHPTTERIQHRFFGGKTFEEFFGFPLPTDSEAANRQYQEFMERLETKRSENTIEQIEQATALENSVKNEEIGSTAGEPEAKVENSSEPQKNSAQAKQVYEDYHDDIDQEVALGDEQSWLKKRRYFRPLFATLTIIGIIGVLETSIHKWASPVINRALTVGTIKLNSENFLVQRLSSDYSGYSVEELSPGGTYIYNYLTSILLLGDFSNTGFNNARLISQKTRNDSDLDWPFQYLVRRGDRVYGRPDRGLLNDRRFLTSYAFVSYPLECPSGLRLVSIPSDYSVGHPNCIDIAIQFERPGELRRMVVDFSEALAPHFSPGLPAIDAVNLEVTEQSEGVFSAMKLTGPGFDSISLLSRIDWSPLSGWGIVFDSEVVQAFEIGRTESTKSVLIYAEDGKGSRLVIVNYYTGKLQSQLVFQERVRFFDVDHSTCTRYCELTVATDHDIYMFRLSYREDNYRPVYDYLWND